eukprot:2430018-Amphidinium_carterae.1
MAELGQEEKSRELKPEIRYAKQNAKATAMYIQTQLCTIGSHIRGLAWCSCCCVVLAIVAGAAAVVGTQMPSGILPQGLKASNMLTSHSVDVPKCSNDKHGYQTERSSEQTTA